MKELKAVFRLFLPYISIFVLSVVSIGYLVWFQKANYEERNVEDMERTVEIAMERFQEQINEIERIAYIMEGNAIIREYAYATLKGQEVLLSDCIEVIEELANCAQGYGLDNIYLYERGNDRIITTDSMVSQAEDYFRFSYQIEGMTFQDSFERLQNSKFGYSPVISVNMNQNVRQVIEYRTRVPANWSKEYSLQMVFVIEAADLFGDFYDIMEDGWEFYVFDRNECLIHKSGNQYETLLDEVHGSDLRQMSDSDKQIYYGVYAASDGEWKLKFFMPKSINAGELEVPHFLGFVVMPLLASVILCIYFTYKNHREFLDILLMLKGCNSESDEEKDQSCDSVDYEMIRKAVAKLIDENIGFKERIADLQAVQKKEVLDKLVHKAYGSKEEITEALKSVRFNYWNSKTIVLCIMYESTGYGREIEKHVWIKELVQKIINGYTENKVEIFDCKLRETVCMLFFEEAQNAETIVRNILFRLNMEIFNCYEIEVKIGVGNLMDSIYEAADTYQQAMDVIRHRQIIESNVYLYSELTAMEDTCYYPMEFDELVYNYVMAGKAEKAKVLVMRLYKENFERKAGMLSVEAIEKLKKRMEECASSVAEKCGIILDEQLTEIRCEQNIQKYFEKFYYLIDQMTVAVGVQTESNQYKLVTNIMEYIHLHYSESSLSVKHVAQVFGFQDRYISRLFKMVYGENMSAVIEKKRIEMACLLLKSAGMQISDISEKVGYDSDVSFRRAFKKVTGVTPGEYRENMGNNS